MRVRGLPWAGSGRCFRCPPGMRSGLRFRLLATLRRRATLKSLAQMSDSDGPSARRIWPAQRGIFDTPLIDYVTLFRRKSLSVLESEGLSRDELRTRGKVQGGQELWMNGS